MTDNGSEERDPPSPTPVVFASDWERDLWREVYMAHCVLGGPERAADGAVRASQARASVSQRPALERLKAGFEAELEAVRDSARNHALPAREREICRAVAVNIWRSAAGMVAKALESE